MAQELRIIGIDPGERHCGVALALGAHVYEAYETDPDTCGHRLQDWLRADAADKLVVCEEFRLYPWQADAQSFSTMATCELIGVIKWMVEHDGIGASLHMQPASILKPTAAICKAKKIRPKGTGPHARAAELHIWHYLLRRQAAC